MAIGGVVQEILTVFGDAKNGLDIFKCKLDGTPTQVSSGGKMKLDGSNVKITCSFETGGSQTSVEVVRPTSGSGETAKINNVAVQNVRAPLSLIKHLTGVDVKATVDYSQGGTAHELEIYGAGPHLPGF